MLISKQHIKVAKNGTSSIPSVKNKIDKDKKLGNI
jgi:hypothetical protein